MMQRISAKITVLSMIFYMGYAGTLSPDLSYRSHIVTYLYNDGARSIVKIAQNDEVRLERNL